MSALEVEAYRFVCAVVVDVHVVRLLAFRHGAGYQISCWDSQQVFPLLT